MIARHFLLFVMLLLQVVSTGVVAQDCRCMARKSILLVGSQTIYPFAAYLGEYLGAATEYPMPMIVAMDSADGITLFNENRNVDIVCSSTRMSQEEFDAGQSSGVGDILEFGFGYDGIVFASYKLGKTLNFSVEDIFLAIVQEVPINGKLVPNPYTRWQQIDSSLPDWEIDILGPDKNSGTFAVLEELILAKMSRKFKEYDGEYLQLRRDGVYKFNSGGEIKIIREIMHNHQSLGIISYGFLENGHEYISGSAIDGIQPARETISDGKYPFTRMLYMYLKLEHIKTISGITDFVNLLLSPKALSKDGVLADLGLITLSAKDYASLRTVWKDRVRLKKEDLE